MRKREYQCLSVVMACTLLFGGMPVNTVQVKAANVIKVKTKKLTITKGKTKTVKISGKRIHSKTYKSSKKAVATVSKKGKVKAKKVGSCKITVTVKYRKTKKAKKLSTKKLTCKVKVVEELLRPQLDLTEEFARQIANTSVKMMQMNAEEPLKKNQNVLISPESVLTAMAMAVNGAKGDTLTELQRTLYGDISVGNFNSNMSNYNDYMTLSKEVQFHLANSIWIRDGIAVKKSFLDHNRKYYRSETFTEPFNDKTKTKMNQWVSQNTKKMIPSIINEGFTKDDRMFLINALAFEGRWMNPYRDYQVGKEPFTNAAGVKQTVNMLNSTEGQYLKDEKSTGVMKYYEGGEFAFVAILPKQGVSVSDYLKEMTGEAFVQLLKSAQSKQVKTKIPEFSYDYSTQMKPTLQKMGISKAFTLEADFGNMLKKETVRISEVLHKTHIKLDRNGTKAAAVTVVRMAKSSAPVEEPKEVYLNRPFIYAIVETSRCLPVFMGVVNSVK